MDSLTITQAELHNLMFTSFAQVDSAFQFWLSGTFAVILVGYLAARKLSAMLAATVAGLYLGLVSAMVLRMAITANHYNQYIQAIEELVPPQMLLPWLALLRAIIILAGTSAALGYLWISFRQARAV
jgi:hypothetical protein